MLVIVMEDQLLSPHQVCQACLMADQSGQPRWNQGKLRCGRALGKATERLPEQFECQMGFRVVHIE
ncbi:MAG: hypothetical protein HC781_11930 [Leptolyngbyaceae cyanobacterium CSU_1_4]|jgi:hypothetical protein|nr:hypothetical protein [Leptolyngbyaceae cyanobacterium CSU_1_4]